MDPPPLPYNWLGLEVEILKDPGEVPRELWERWAREHPLGVQLAPWFLGAWWETSAREPAAALALEQGKPTGLAFFEVFENRALKGLARFRVLEFMAQRTSDFSDILGPLRDKRALVLRAAKALKADFINLRNIPEGSGLGPEPHTVALVVEPKTPWEEYFRRLPKSLRKNLRRAERALGEAEFWAGTPSLELLEEMRELDLKREFKSPFKDERLEFMKKILPRAHAFTLRLRDRLVAFRFGFLWRKTYFAWRTSYEPAFAEASPGLYLLHLSLRWCWERGFSFNFMRGDEAHKRPWATGEVRLFRWRKPVSLKAKLYKIFR